MKLSDEHVDFDSLYAKYGGLGNLQVDLGCGFYKPEGFIGLDNMEGAGSQDASAGVPPDVNMDLHNEALPFPDSSVALIRTSHYLEHSKLDWTFTEVHRVLRKGGVFDNTMPYGLSDDGLYPGHTIFLTEKWFQENLLFQRLFKIKSLTYDPSPEYLAWPRATKKLIPFSWGRRHLFNVCTQCRLVAEKREI